jgi:hypothetical protein
MFDISGDHRDVVSLLRDLVSGGGWGEEFCGTSLPPLHSSDFLLLVDSGAEDSTAAFAHLIVHPSRTPAYAAPTSA